MNYVVIIRALLSGWWILAAATAVGTVAAFLITTITPPTFKASTSFYVSVAGQETGSAGEIASGSTAAQQKIKSYTELASSPRVLEQVIERLDLDTTPALLSEKVTSTVGTGTVIISISATDNNARTAARIAGSIGTALSAVVSEIEPETADGTASVRLEEVMPATVPTSPVAPKKAFDLLLGLGAGLAAGAALALLRAAADTRVRDAEDLDPGLPLVGDIGLDTDASRSPLIVRDDASSVRSEAFRSLRTNIQFLRTAGAPTIAVTSARPAEGKTTTTANLGIALSKGGTRTVIIDADLRRPNLATTMGIEGAVGLTDLLVGRAEIEDVLQEWGTDGLSVLPAGTIPPNPSELIGSEAMDRVVAELAARFDVVLVDTPPVLAVTDAALVSTLVSMTLLVTAANQTKRSDVRLAVAALERVGQRPSGVVLTKTKHKASRYAYYRSEYASRPANA
ncbi:polysaccharide biosynthesis tyrosine autokinase [Curtobacterium pusillum]|uniref:polysaccharide biosynthesis tyrosine autokinase n=1 Tax=Curtobacterium pusillum TaxID=69373 RepID=UPI0011A0D014|nr:polysaccharide biosynthesis tyrosine autokinase [Curtobacterium pusillum]